jgi:SOS-response transcriptional repressor LexA
MTMGFGDDGDPTTGRTEEAVDTVDDRMDFEETTDEFIKNLEKNSGSTSLQKEAERSARTSTSTSTSATVTATGMKKIEEEDEGKEEEEDELGMKTTNWRKINLSFTVVLEGQDGKDIKAPDQLHEGNNNNDNKMKHHPIMSKIAKFMLAIKKKCETEKIMSSKKQMVLDAKACIDSWSINEVKKNSPIQLQRVETGICTSNIIH